MGSFEALEASSISQHFDGRSGRALRRLALTGYDSVADLSRLTLGYVVSALCEAPSDLDLVLTTYEKIVQSLCEVSATTLQDSPGADCAVAPELATDSAALLSVWVLPLRAEVCHALESTGVESVSRLASDTVGHVLGMWTRRAVALSNLVGIYRALESVSSERLDRMGAVFGRGARHLLVESARACGWSHAERDMELVIARSRAWRNPKDVTYEVLGKRLRVSRERVRQMLNRATTNRWGGEFASTIHDLALPFVAAVRRAGGLASARDLVEGKTDLWPLRRASVR